MAAVTSQQRSTLVRGSCLLALAVISLFGAPAQAALLGTYSFTGTGTSGDGQIPTSADSRVTFGAFSRAGVTANAVDNVFSSTSWSTANALDTTKYVQFVVTPISGVYLKDIQLSFDALRIQGNNVDNGAVQISWNGGSSSLVNFTPGTGITVSFTGLETAAGQDVTVRFYGWNANNSKSELNFDNVAFNATVVPEPVTVALGVFGTSVGLLHTGRWLRRRKLAANIR